MGNKLSDLPLDVLRRMLRETERAAGPDAQGTAILRRAVASRESSAPRRATLGPLEAKDAADWIRILEDARRQGNEEVARHALEQLRRLGLDVTIREPAGAPA